jgi:ribosomal protein S18 acetylase RimI-like enzyme
MLSYDKKNMIKIKKYNSLFYIKKFIPLYNEFYKSKSKKDILKGLKTLKKTYKYNLLVAFKDDEPIAIAGLTYGYLLYCNKFLRLSNIYVKEEYRKLGVAHLLIAKAEIIAKNNKCAQIILDSYIDNNNAHKTYFKEGFSITAYHFTKEV